MKWIEASPVSVSAELLEAVDGNNLVAEALARRGFTDPAEVQSFLDPAFYQPTSSLDIPNMALAVDIIESAIEQEKVIGVWGDFDVDGQTSTTLLVSALKELGAKVIFHIPVRATESHGINIENLDHLIQEGAQVLLTCDTGISDHESVTYARDHGLQIVITDHHDLPPSLPDADAIINSKMLPAQHPLATLPGVGVAYKLIEALYLRKNREEELDKFLDLVALGIVADVALLQGDARYLVQRGIQVLRQTKRLGLQTLFDAANIQAEFITEGQIGFMIAPRLNALGRLGDANMIVEYFTTEDQSRARIITNQLEGLNAQRKLLTKQVFEGALAKIEQDPSLLQYSALVLAHENWPAGVVGIVASRLVERFNKPVILLASPQNENARGSARSVEGCDISKAIAACKDLLEGFGGHPMAAGLSISSDRIGSFRKQLSDEVANQLGKDLLEPDLTIDAWLSFENLSLNMVDQVDQLAPFGTGNPVLKYASGDLQLVSHAPLGRSGEHLQLIIEDEAGHRQKVFWWNGVGWELPKGKFELAFTANSSIFKGERELQVEFVDFQIVDEGEPEEDVQTITVIDHREEKEPEQVLEKIREQEESLIVWAEGEDYTGVVRGELASAEALVIWNIPPSYSVLKRAIALVSPQKIYVFGINPDMDNVEVFLKRLTGLVKYSIAHKEGHVNLNELASLTCQTKAAVRIGISWLESKGYFSVVREENNLLVVSEEKNENKLIMTPEEILAVIIPLFRESFAFRKHFGSSNSNKLIELLTFR